MPVLPSYRNQSIDLLAFNGLIMNVLKYALETVGKINYQNLENAFIETLSKQSYENEVGKGKSGALYDESFTQSNCEKIGIRN